MKLHKAHAVLLVAALSGSLLIGCSSDNAKPPANPLVGTWLAQGPGDNPIVVLEMAADGTWNYRWGPTRDSVVDPGEGSGTYQVNGKTVTWLGGACDAGAKGIYTYDLEKGQFTQTARDDPCAPRYAAYNGVTFKAETTSPQPSAN